MKATFILLLCGLSLLGFSQTTAIKSRGVKHPVYLGKTRPLKNIAPLEEQINSEESVEKISPIAKRSLNAKYDDPVIQDYKGQNDPILVLHDFEGLSSQGSPNPDTEGDVGPNHYFQMVKSEFAIWDKQGTLLYGPAANVTLWSDFPGPWLELGWTDPVVLYDHLADRWLASCMVYDINVEYYEMIAVSATPDPLGEWFCYYVWFDVMPDYPKFGVWPDGYYLSINEWEIVGSYATFQGASILAFNREELMNGTADPTVIYFHFDAPNHSTTTDIGSFLPCDLDGISPPEGTPNYFVCVKDDAWGYPEDRIWIWACSVDWNDTSNCTFSEVAVLETEPFDSHNFEHIFIHQPNSSIKLHSLSHFLMYRLQYRNFGNYQSMVANHTVEVDGNEHAGIRWFELRNEGSGWYIHQQSTYAPDEDSRWMASVAMDRDGNLALGYSVSGDATYPSIRASGRFYNDENSLLSFPELEIRTGTASQTIQGRWGDYSTMSVDPNDEYTFWYTQEYMETSGPVNWQTRITSFQLQRNINCSEDSLLFVTPGQCIDGLPITLKNNSFYPVSILQIETEGMVGPVSWWVADPLPGFPFDLPSGDSVNLIIKVELPSSSSLAGIIFDSLTILTDYKEYQVIIGLNDNLISSSGTFITDMNSIEVLPNPFTRQTRLRVYLENASSLKIEIFDHLFRQIQTLVDADGLKKGSHEFVWKGMCHDNTELPNGIYYCIIQTGQVKQFVKLIKI